MANEKFCPRCGHTYTNFCVVCKRQGLTEKTDRLMEQAGLTDEVLISELAQHVLEDRLFAAWKEAADMKGLRQPQKTETKIEVADGDSQARLADIIAGFAKRGGAGGGDSGS